MQKRIKSLLCLMLACAMLFAVVACGGTDGGDGSGSAKPTYLTRAKELAEGIDKVPSMSSIFGIGENGGSAAALSSTSGVEPSLLSCPSGYIDVTDPKDNEDYQAALATGRPRQMDMYATAINNSDLSVSETQRTKNRALNGIVQLNTWVKGVGTSPFEKYRMSYDALSDVVTIEILEESNYLGKHSIQYRHISATYNEKGEAVISAFYLRTYDGVMDMTESIYFEENNYFTVVFDSNGNDEIFGDEEVYDYFCYSDLSSTGKDTVCMYRNGTMTFSRTGEERAFVLSESKEFSQIIFESAKGERLGYMNIYEGVRIDFNMDLYALGGITGIYKNGTAYAVEVDGAPLKGGTYFDQCWGLTQVSATPNEDLVPFLRLGVSTNSASTLSEKEIMDGSLAELGVTIADASALRQYQLAADLEAFYNSFRVLSDVGYVNVDGAWIGGMMEKLMITKAEPADLPALAAEPSIEKNAQVADDTYYAIFAAQLAGAAIVDAQTLQIGLGDVTASAALSAMLSVGEEYALVAALWDGEVQPVCEVLAICTETGISVTGLASIDVTALDEGQYTVRVFLAKKTADGYTRISQFLVPTTAQPTTASLTQGEMIYTVVADADVITITVEAVPAEPTEGEAA